MPETKNIPMLDIAAQHAPIQAELRAAIDEVLENHRYINGPQVGLLESAVAAYCGCEAAVGVSSGTDALLLALMALGIGPGDEVITSPYTFFATAGSIWRTGARPVFVDIQPDTFNLNPDRVEACITSRTKAIMPVHLFGQVARMDPLLELAQAHDLQVIEDAAQSIGALHSGRQAGSMGAAGCLSFFPSKNLGAMGDAGMVVTRDEELAERMKVLRAHGAKPKYFHSLVGGNFRLDTLQAAVLLVKLPYLPAWSEQRRHNAALYDTLLADVLQVTTPVVRPENFSIFNQYVIRAERRDELAAFLKDRGMASAIYYPRPLHLQGCFAELGHKLGDFPESEMAALQTLALPVYPELGAEGVSRVAVAVREFYRR